MDIKNEKIKSFIQEKYGEIARVNSCGCCGGSEGISCCNVDPETAVRIIGYSQDELKNIPVESNMGLGCGNPQAIAGLQVGETVLDLGSGGGLDCFLASRAVGESGRVIGVDMTPEMIDKASQLAVEMHYNNVEFHLGEIENIPVKDNLIDVIMSNCVINLSPDKPRVFREAYRVLKKGGRLAISDIVATAVLPETIKNDLALHASCIAGAVLIEDIERMLQEAGFEEILITPVDQSRDLIRDWAPSQNVQGFVVSASIEAIKR